MRELTALEARILGVLVEKQATVPDTYPLSLNALLAGCNQKTARHPVMEASEAELLRELDALRSASLVVEVSGARVVRYEHNLPRALGLPGAAVALLAVLMLRGPQTAAELRLHSERLHRFADLSSVEGFLDELAAKDPPRVRVLPRAAGEREPRWVHLLCGESGLPAAGAPVGPAFEPVGSAGAEAVDAAGLAPAPGAGLRFVLPQARRLVHECLIPVRWGDMDAMGHVNNTVYFRYLEIVRLEWLEAIGAPVRPQAGQGVVIVNAFCNFLRQVEYPATLRARLFVTPPGRSSFDTYVTLERTDAPGEVCAEGGARAVWTDYGTRRAMPLPEGLRARLA